MSAGIFTCNTVFNQVKSCPFAELSQSLSESYVSLAGCPQLFHLIHCQPSIASFGNFAILSNTAKYARGFNYCRVKAITFTTVFMTVKLMLHNCSPTLVLKIAEEQSLHLLQH